MEMTFEQKNAILDRCGHIFLQKIIISAMFMSELVTAKVLDGFESQNIQAEVTPEKTCNALLAHLRRAPVKAFVTFCIILHDEHKRQDIIEDFGLNIGDLRSYRGDSKVQQFWEVLPLIKDHCESGKLKLQTRNVYDCDHPSPKRIATSDIWIDVKPLCHEEIEEKEIPGGDILKPFNDAEAPRTIHLYAPPGGGKSLLMEHIFYEWAREFLEKAKSWVTMPKSWEEVGLIRTMMVYVSTQMIKGGQHGLENIIRRCLWCKEEDKQKLLDYVMKGYGVLVFFDDLSKTLSGEICKEIRSELQEFIETRNDCGGAQVVVSSRTFSCFINSRAFRRFLRLPGFTEDQYQRYIQMYLSKHKDLDELLQCIKREHNKLHPILKIPLYLHILCAMISKGDLKVKDINKFSEWFPKLVDHLRDREGNGLSGEDIDRFCKLCFINRLRGIREFDESVERNSKVQKQCATFMVKARGTGTSATSPIWAFPHETLQECFAGCYFKNLRGQKQKSLLVSVCSEPKFQKAVAAILLQMGGEYDGLLKTMIRCILISQHDHKESRWYRFKALFTKKCYDVLKAMQKDISKIAKALDTEEALQECLEGEVEHGDVEDIWERLDKVFDEEVDAFRKAQWYHGLKQGVIDNVKLCLEGCPEELRADIMKNTVDHLLPLKGTQVTRSWTLGSRQIITYLLKQERWAELNVWPVSSLLNIFTGRLKVHAWSPDDARMLIENDSKSKDCSKKDKIARLVQIQLNQYRELHGTPPMSIWTESEWNGLVEQIKMRWRGKKVIIELDDKTPLCGLLTNVRSHMWLPQIVVERGEIHHDILTGLIEVIRGSGVQLKSTTIAVPSNLDEAKRISDTLLSQKKPVLLEPIWVDDAGQKINTVLSKMTGERGDIEEMAALV